jgi:hypothetical protein
MNIPEEAIPVVEEIRRADAVWGENALAEQLKESTP